VIDLASGLGLRASGFGLLTAGLLVAAAAAQAPVRPTGAGASPQLPPRDTVAATGKGILRGRVTRLDNGQPLRRVLVTIAAPGLSQTELPSVLTDTSGRFELAGLPAARYTLTASRDGFVTLQYGQRRPNQPGQPINLTAGAKLEGVDLALPRGGAVTGWIFDEDGEPVANATVELLRQRYVGGRPQLSPSVATPDVTDDRGAFRVYGIPPGAYYVSATKSAAASGSGRGGPPRFQEALAATATFYPGTSSPEAARQITVGLGEEVAGISYSLVPSTPAAILLTIRTPDGQLAPATTQVMFRRTSATSSVGGSARPGPDGSFRWTDLPPGEYAIQAVAWTAAGSSGETAAARVMLDGIDAKVDLILQKADTVRGRITFDADAAVTSLRPDQVRVRPVAVDPLEPASAGTPRTNADWTFETDVTQGARLLRVSVPTGWALKSVRADGVDVTDTPLLFNGKDVGGIEILVTDKLTEVSGTIREAGGRVVTDASVVLLADDPAKWTVEGRFVAVVRPDQTGRFVHRGLPAARYIAIALDYLEPGEETNPETLRHLRSAGASFTLADRESKTLDLTLTNLP
jgi:hypothetical protein